MNQTVPFSAIWARGCTGWEISIRNIIDQLGLPGNQSCVPEQGFNIFSLFFPLSSPPLRRRGEEGEIESLRFAWTPNFAITMA